MTIISENPAPATTPQVEADRIPRWSDARDQMIHACALQEHIIATAPFLPARITVVERIALEKGYKFSAPEDDLVAMLHRGQSPAAYQSFLGGEFTVTPHPSDDGRVPQVKEELTGEAFGCSFRIWVLRDAAAEPVDAEKRPSVVPVPDLCACWDEFVRLGHNADPLDWPEAERAEYAAFAAAFNAAQSSVVTA